MPACTMFLQSLKYQGITTLYVPLKCRVAEMQLLLGWTGWLLHAGHQHGTVFKC